MVKKIFILIFTSFLLTACGNDGDSQASKGHRDAIKIQCKGDPDPKLCGLEVRKRFLEDGNEFVDLEELNKDQIKRVKLECIRVKKFGLESYNKCLNEYKVAALGGTLTEKTFEPKPKSHVAKLENSTVRIGVIEGTSKEDAESVGGGSGVILDNRIIATNCHVALVKKNPNKESVILIKNINQKNYALAEIYKEAKEHDICLLKRVEDSEFSFKMSPVKKFIKFSDLEKGEFVRALGTPEGLEGHTASGEINYFGLAGDSGHTNYGYEISPKTKIISHSAVIAPGSSGGPLFDKDGNLIGLNTFGNEKLNFAVSADHIREIWKN